MPRHATRATRRLALPVLLVALAACTDRNPTAPGEAPQTPTPAPFSALLCTADVRAASLVCAPQGVAPGVSAVILGGQGTNVRLASSGTAYDSATSVLRSDVTVENLTAQVLGMVDGTTLSPQGVRVFFHSGPTVTGGTGVVTIANADGTGDYTGAAQPYFQYAGPLAPGDTTAAREWRFNVPGTVSTFTFTVYVAAQVRAEAGLIKLAPVAPSLMPGDTQRIAVSVRSVTGAADHGAPVAWWTSNPAVATVDSLGLVTAVSAGTATITATSGERSGNVQVRVNPSVGTSAPALTSMEMSRASILADGVDSIMVRLGVKGIEGAGIYTMRVNLRHANGRDVHSCAFFTLVSGTADDGVYECRLTFQIPWGRRGTWRVENVEVVGYLGGTRTVANASLLAAGVQTQLQVEHEDATAPTVLGFAVVADSVRAGVEQAVMAITWADSASELSDARVLLRSPNGTRFQECRYDVFTRGGSGGETVQCYTMFNQWAQAGAWTVEQLRVEDMAGNIRTLTTADLQAAGFPTAVHVENDPANEDLAAPSVTSLSISPATVAGTTLDSLTVSMQGDDNMSGVQILEAHFQKVGVASRTRRCNVFGPVPLGTTASLTCKLTFNAAEAGAWQVTSLRAVDRAGNFVILDLEDAQALSFPTGFTVTAP